MLWNQHVAISAGTTTNARVVAPMVFHTLLLLLIVFFAIMIVPRESELAKHLCFVALVRSNIV